MSAAGQQMSLDVTGMFRSTDPDTSEGAAVVAIHTAATDRERVRTLLAEHPEGLSDFELGELTGRKSTSIGKRRGELRDLGLAERARDANGCWEQRLSDTNTPCAVWRLTPAGFDSYRRGLPVPQPQRARRARRPKPEPT